MSFKATSDKINIEEMRSLSKLTGEALAKRKHVIVNWFPLSRERTTVYS